MIEVASDAFVIASGNVQATSDGVPQLWVVLQVKRPEVGASTDDGVDEFRRVVRSHQVVVAQPNRRDEENAVLLFADNIGCSIPRASAWGATFTLASSPSLSFGGIEELSPGFELGWVNALGRALESARQGQDDK